MIKRKHRITAQKIILFLTLFLIVSLPNIAFPEWKKEFWDEFFDAVGIILVLFGFLFRIAARGYKEEHSSCGKTLVSNGPYCLVRNPMYFGTLLIGVGVIAALFALWTLPLFLLVFLLIYIPQITREENYLSAEFGEKYEIYRKKTPKYFPRLRALFRFKDYLPLKVSWLKKELVSLTGVIAMIIFIELWEDVKRFGTNEFFTEILKLPLIIIIFFIMIAGFFKHNKTTADN